MVGHVLLKNQREAEAEATAATLKAVEAEIEVSRASSRESAVRGGSRGSGRAGANPYEVRGGSVGSRCVARDSNSGHQLLLPRANWCPIFAFRTTQVHHPVGVQPRHSRGSDGGALS